MFFSGDESVPSYLKDPDPKRRSGNGSAEIEIVRHHVDAVEEFIRRARDREPFDRECDHPVFDPEAPRASAEIAVHGIDPVARDFFQKKALFRGLEDLLRRRVPGLHEEIVRSDPGQTVEPPLEAFPVLETPARRATMVL